MIVHSESLQAYRAALDWWSDAGVDCDFADEASPWLREEETADKVSVAQAPAAKAPEQPDALERALARTTQPAIGGDRTGWPSDLPSFAEWWLHEPTLDDHGIERRVAPRGSTNPALMVLVCQPDEDDRQVLLSGEQGRVLDAFARVAGLDEEGIYVASALPCPTPLPDWPSLADRGLGDVVKHHVALVQPRRLLFFGRSLAGLTGSEPATKFLGDIPLMIAPALETIGRYAARKKRFWQEWLEWTA